VTLLKSIPKVDRILATPALAEMLTCHARPVVLAAVRAALDGLRAGLLAGSAGPAELALPAVVDRVRQELARASAPSLRRVVNGTGVVIHTNLGRSPLPPAATYQLEEIAFHYSNLEFDLASGERGSRYSHVEALLCELTGAEAALVVNNNAAAVLLALSSLASGREAIVSRGELVEIGGSFRIPDVMRQSGVLLREVGTTNRTHLRDYRDAVGPATGLLLKVHCSNFAVVGFTAEVTAAELAALGREAGIPVMADVGSGSLIDLRPLLGCGEAPLQEFIQAGVDVVTASGDKLLGGPQIGLVIGRKSCIEPMKRHPLLRALRVDKMTLATLEATLQLYRDERQALREIPTLRMLTMPADELATWGRTLLRRLRRQLPPSVRLAAEPGFSQVGGGALPLLELPTTLLRVTAEDLPPHLIEKRLRTCATPVIGRIAKGAFLLDVRTICADDLPLLAAGLGCLVP
jgi:L-seryl-tRNA(Ser) seleniumtransferase